MGSTFLFDEIREIPPLKSVFIGIFIAFAMSIIFIYYSVKVTSNEIIHRVSQNPTNVSGIQQKLTKISQDDVSLLKR